MKTTINETKNYCGHYVGKPLRVTTNRIGKTWCEPIGWTARQATWLTVPRTLPGYIGRELKTYNV